MIFLVTGHQTPFDRLVRAVDRWSQLDGRRDVFGQIGKGSYQPTHFDFTRFLAPPEFRARIEESSAVVAHAGTGTIIEVLERGKPLLVMPRVTRLGETRNDHQIATARHFEQAGYVLSASDEEALIQRLREIESFRPARALASGASPRLLTRLREFLAGPSPT